MDGKSTGVLTQPNGVQGGDRMAGPDRARGDVVVREVLVPVPTETPFVANAANAERFGLTPRELEVLLNRSFADWPSTR